MGFGSGTWPVAGVSWHAVGSQVGGLLGRVAVGLALAGLVTTSGCASARELNGVRVSEGSKGRSLEPADVAQRSAGSVGVVITDSGRGLGFVVDPSGFMITNRHVVEDADYIEKVHFPGLDPAPEYEQVEIVYIDPVRDLALLHIQSEDPLPYLRLATRQDAPVSAYVDAADEVVLLSREVDPDDAEELEEDPGLLAHTGRVERLEVYNANVGPGPFLGVSARIEQGQSGGPVLDRWGRAVGVVTWTWKDQKGGFAIPISEAARMLEERPKLGTVSEQTSRAEDRAKDYLAALGGERVDDLRRLTSPSRARELRGDTVDVLIERSVEGVMQGFLQSLEELLASSMERRVDPFEGLQFAVERSSDDASLRKMGVAGSMSREAVGAFFYEIGTAYMAARWFGEYDPRGALMVALQRVHSLDAARSMVLMQTVDELGGVRANIEQLEVVESFGGPQAIAVVDVGHGKRIQLRMRLEWGDWYVSEIETLRGKTKLRTIGVQKG